MKNWLSLLFAGIIGGCTVLGGMYFFAPNKHNVSPYDQQVSYVNANNNNYAVPFDFKDAAKKAMPVVVHITASKEESLTSRRNRNPFSDLFGEDWFYGGGPQQGTGSGVIYSDDGYIITNNHVIDFADKVEVTLFDNRTYKAKVVGTDKTTDLAVLKIEAENLPVPKLGDSDKAEVGEWVLAVGNPFDLTSTVTAGIISAKARDINILSGKRSVESFIQTDAAVNPGNSGGALVDAEGNLIGINTAIATRTGSFAGYSFAIPVEIVTKIVDDLIKHGEVKRALIGIDVEDLDSDHVEELRLKGINQGVVIVGVLEGTAAQYAGLVPDDVITKVDGQTIKSAPELQGFMSRKRPGDIVTFTIVRNGKNKDVPVRLKAG